MHILVCTHDFDNGGSARSLSILLRHLAPRHSITLLTLMEPNPRKGMARLYRDMGIHVHYFPWGWLPISYRGCAVDVDAEYRRTENQRPYISQVKALFVGVDVVCFNSYPSTSLATLMPSALPKYLIAREVIDETSPRLKDVIPFLRRHIRCAAAIGPVEARQLKQWGIPHTVVYNTGPDTPQFRPLPPVPPVRFGVFGQLGPAKGQDQVVLACEGIARDLREAGAKIHIFGGCGGSAFDEYGLYLHTLVQQRNLQDVVVMEGWVDDVEKYMAAMHCVVRPDATGSPWGRDVIEAMSMGRPMVATGTEDVFIKPGRTGWLVPPGVPPALGRVLAALARSPGELEDLSRNAFAFAREHFDPHRNVARLEGMLSGRMDERELSR